MCCNGTLTPDECIRPMNPRGDLSVFEVPRQECVDIRLSFRQLFHALDHVVVEDKTVGFRGLDDAVKHRARISTVWCVREQPDGMTLYT